MYISCPKFEEHFSNISGDSLDVTASIQGVFKGRFNSSFFVVRMVLEYSQITLSLSLVFAIPSRDNVP